MDWRRGVRRLQYRSRRGADLAGRHPADGASTCQTRSTSSTTSRPPWSRTPPSRGCSSSCSRRGSTPLGMRVRRTRSAEAESAIAEVLALDDVRSLDQDRIIRALLGAVQAALRTNFYQSDSGGPKSYVSLKLDPTMVPDLPAPRPVRDLGLRAARRGRAPPLRQGRPRWAALVGPTRGLPHRDPRSGQGADGQERRHRPTGSKGGFYAKRCRPHRGPGRLARRGGRRIRAVHLRPARPDRQPDPGDPAAERRAS